MNAILALVLSLLFGQHAAEVCQPGTLVLYEDMSYKIVEDSGSAVCNIEINAATAHFTQIDVHEYGNYSVRETWYSFSYPFPESALVKTVSANLFIETMEPQ